MFLFVSIVVLLIALAFWNDTKKPKNYPKGPKWLPIVGNFAHFKKRWQALGYHHLVWQELSERYGNVVGLRLGRTLVVTVFKQEAVMEILSREEFDGRPDGFFFRFRTFGKRLGVIFSDGSFWQKQRKFSLHHLRNFGFGKKQMQAIIEEEVKDLVDVLRQRCSSPVKMHNIFDVSVLNILWAMIAGERFALDDSRLKELMDIIHEAFKLIDMSGGLVNQMPFLRHVAPDLCGYTRIVEILKKLFTFLEETINEHKKTLCSSHPRDFIDAFLQKMQEESDETFTLEQLYSLCLDFFMAGSETTSNTLGFAVLYMLKYPEVQRKVQEEMDAVTGGNRWPTLQDRLELPYTEAVLMEIQRITNIPPLGIAHRAVKDAELLGYTIPEGTIILTSLHSVHMDADLWGDPESFRPERFLDSGGKLTVPEKNFIPFGYGKRRCLGESLARANYFIFFSTFFHNFKVTPDLENPDPELRGNDGITISPKPYTVRLTPRL